MVLQILASDCLRRCRNFSRLAKICRIVSPKNLQPRIRYSRQRARQNFQFFGEEVFKNVAIFVNFVNFANSTKMLRTSRRTVSAAMLTPAPCAAASVASSTHQARWVIEHVEDGMTRTSKRMEPGLGLAKLANNSPNNPKCTFQFAELRANWLQLVTRSGISDYSLFW